MLVRLCESLSILLLGFLDLLSVAVKERSAVGLGRRQRERVPVSQLHPPLHDLLKWFEIQKLVNISTIIVRHYINYLSRVVGGCTAVRRNVVLRRQGRRGRDQRRVGGP